MQFIIYVVQFIGGQMDMQNLNIVYKWATETDEQTALIQSLGYIFFLPFDSMVYLSFVYLWLTVIKTPDIHRFSVI